VHVATPCVTAEHVCEHEPQWAGSVVTSTQLEPQRVSPAAHPLLQP
jgi:hypothetical protein